MAKNKNKKINNKNYVEDIEFTYGGVTIKINIYPGLESYQITTGMGDSDITNTFLLNESGISIKSEQCIEIESTEAVIIKSANVVDISSDQSIGIRCSDDISIDVSAVAVSINAGENTLTVDSSNIALNNNKTSMVINEEGLEISAETISFDGNCKFSGNVEIEGQCDIDSDINVGGKVDIGGNVLIGGNIEIEQLLNVQSDSNMSGNLNVEGNVGVSGVIEGVVVSPFERLQKRIPKLKFAKSESKPTFWQKVFGAFKNRKM